MKWQTRGGRFGRRDYHKTAVMLRRALRQVWMHRIDDVSSIDAILRHPAFRDRAVLERALSQRFFAPFSHQEVLRGDAFEARARWSRAALAGVGVDRVRAAGQAAAAREVQPGEIESLLDHVRRTVSRATVDLVVGGDGIVDVVDAAVSDIDRGIKMIARANDERRHALSLSLEPIVAQPDAWPDDTYLGASREEARSFSVAERVDHVAAVFFATGVIQVSDVVTHALIALAQSPERCDASDEAVVAEVIRLYPVNSSITRRPGIDVAVGGRLYRRGEPITVVPARLERTAAFDPGREQGPPAWSFGVGPRACPARRVATTLAATVLGGYRRAGVQIEPGYRHQRSLAASIRARIGPGDAPATTARLRRALAFGRFAAVCAESYPAAFLRGLSDLAEEIAAR